MTRELVPVARSVVVAGLALYRDVAARPLHPYTAGSTVVGWRLPTALTGVG